MANPIRPNRRLCHQRRLAWIIKGRILWDHRGEAVGWYSAQFLRFEFVEAAAVDSALGDDVFHVDAVQVFPYVLFQLG